MLDLSNVYHRSKIWIVHTITINGMDDCDEFEEDFNDPSSVSSGIL
jgi:hypothetical protein